MLTNITINRSYSIGSTSQLRSISIILSQGVIFVGYCVGNWDVHSRCCWFQGNTLHCQQELHFIVHTSIILLIYTLSDFFMCWQGRERNKKKFFHALPCKCQKTTHSVALLFVPCILWCTLLSYSYSLFSQKKMRWQGSKRNKRNDSSMLFIVSWKRSCMSPTVLVSQKHCTATLEYLIWFIPNSTQHWY